MSVICIEMKTHVVPPEYVSKGECIYCEEGRAEYQPLRNSTGKLARQGSTYRDGNELDPIGLISSYPLKGSPVKTNSRC